MDLKSMIIYTFVTFFLIFIIISERQDTNSINNKSEWGPRKGKAYYTYQPMDTDSKEQLVNKLIKTSRYEFNSTSWRRCMILAIVSALIGLTLIHRELPDGRSLGIMIIVIFMISYFIHRNYQKSIGIPATKQIVLITEKLNY